MIRNFTNKSNLHPDTQIYRYINLEKINDLLATQELHFSNIKNVFSKWDHNEGCYPSKVLNDLLYNISDDMSNLNSHDLEVEKFLFNEVLYDIHENSYGMCWYLSSKESEKMWYEYGGGKDNNHGVMLRSTIGSFNNLKDVDFKFIGSNINYYVDDKNYKIYPEKNVVYSLIRKLKLNDYDLFSLIIDSHPDYLHRTPLLDCLFNKVGEKYKFEEEYRIICLGKFNLNKRINNCNICDNKNYTDDEKSDCITKYNKLENSYKLNNSKRTKINLNNIIHEITFSPSMSLKTKLKIQQDASKLGVKYFSESSFFKGNNTIFDK